MTENFRVTAAMLVTIVQRIRATLEAHPTLTWCCNMAAGFENPRGQYGTSADCGLSSPASL
jgi:hypothetical protein